jgi:hypothetical protein
MRGADGFRNSGWPNDRRAAAVAISLAFECAMGCAEFAFTGNLSL